MRPSSLIERLEPLRTSPDRDLLMILVDSPSTAETNLALQGLDSDHDERTLLAALNLRDLLRELPHCPTALGVDRSVLVRSAGLQPSGHGHEKPISDRASLHVLLDGKFCLDVQVRVGTVSAGHTPEPDAGELVDSRFLDLVFEEPAALDALVELFRDAGLAIDPTFYVSVADWRYEHAQGTMQELAGLF